MIPCSIFGFNFSSKIQNIRIHNEKNFKLMFQNKKIKFKGPGLKMVRKE
jgi:hypothetical protein